MKKFLFIALLLIVSCETISDSESTIKLFKCLLLDSDVTYNHLNNLVEAVKTMDPVKLANVFSTLYPAISIEVARCQKESANENIAKPEVVEEVVKEEIKEEKKEEKKEEEKKDSDFIQMIWKLFIQYALPFLKTLGLDLAGICKMFFPDSFYCDLLSFL